MAEPGTVTYLDSPPDILALRIDGTLTRAGFDPLFERLNALFAAHAKVHLYVEVVRYGGIALEDFGHYLAHALPMLAKLDHFGRVAVVTDEAWIRAMVKFESLFLPHITYRTFTLAEAPAALDWIKTE